MLNICIWNQITQEGMWLQGFSHKLQVETRRADTSCSCHASYYCFIYAIFNCCTSTLLRFMGGWWPPSIQPPTFLLRFWQRDTQHFKTKTICYLPSLAPFEVFFFNNFTSYLWICLNGLNRVRVQLYTRIDLV